MKGNLKLLQNKNSVKRNTTPMNGDMVFSSIVISYFNFVELV